MLTLTRNASDIVSQIIDKRVESNGGGEGGLRIAGPNDGAFSIAAVPAGEPGDTVVESGNATVYLEESASSALDDKILDAHVDADGKVEFHLARQD